MIKNLQVKDVRGINETFNLKELNVVKGSNGSGKSTILDLIKDMYRGKSSIKSGNVILTDIDKMIISINNGVLSNSPGIGNNMMLCIPGFFMRGNKIKGVNDTKEDRRKIISNIIGINRSKFFEDKKVSEDIKGLISELKSLEIQEQTLTDELIELQSIEVKEIKKPKEIKLLNDNIKEYELIKQGIDNIKIKEIPERLDKPKEVKLIQGNKSSLDLLQKELEDIVNEGKNIPTVCNTCGQVIKDAEDMRLKLRTKWQHKVREINGFDLVESNQIEYEIYKDKVLQYQIRDKEIENVKRDNTNSQLTLKQLKESEKNFKLVKGNVKEYEEYQRQLRDYESANAVIESNSHRLKYLEKKIKDIPTLDIKSKIKKYKECERDFIEWIQNKLVIGDLKFIFYKKRKSPNTNGEMYDPEFNIEYKGKLYDGCSSGERGAIDIILSTIFIKAQGFDIPLLIDDAEISSENLSEVIKDYCDGLQVIASRIDKGGLKLVHTIK